MAEYRTRDCECKAPVVLGGKRPERCDHGNRFLTEAELKPKQRQPTGRGRNGSDVVLVSTGGLRRGRGFAVHPKQRAKVKGLPCAACGRAEDEWTAVDPAHVWPRGKGGCDHPDCVIPLCRTCHVAFDGGDLELLPSLIDRGYWVEMAHPTLCHQVSPYTLTERLTLSGVQAA